VRGTGFLLRLEAGEDHGAADACCSVEAVQVQDETAGVVHHGYTTKRNSREALVEMRDVEVSARVDHVPKRLVALSLVEQAENRKGLDGDETLVVPATNRDAKNIPKVYMTQP